MADDESPRTEPEIVPPSPAPPPSREPRRDPGVIEGEARELGAPPHQPGGPDDGGGPPPAEPAAPEATAPEPAISDGAPRPRRSQAFLVACLGAVVGTAIALGAAWLLDPRAAEIDAVNSRLVALQANAQAATSANAALDKRVGALETNTQEGAAKLAGVDALAQRVAALETGAGESEVAQNALDEARAARGDAAKALALASGPQGAAPGGEASAAPDASALAARVGQIESDLAALKPATADLARIAGRLAAVETALGAPKSEARVAASETSPPSGGAASAILAISLADGFAAGRPYAEELAALTRLGADSAKLAALKPFADAGAPTPAALAAAYAKDAPAVASAAAPASEGGVLDRFVAHMRGLVRVHKVGDASASDPEGLASRVSASLARGDLAAALDAYSRLPEPARQAGADWAALAQARQAAAVAALALRNETVARLAAAKD